MVYWVWDVLTMYSSKPVGLGKWLPIVVLVFLQYELMRLSGRPTKKQVMNQELSLQELTQAYCSAMRKESFLAYLSLYLAWGIVLIIYLKT